MKWSKYAHANSGRKCENKKSFKSHKKANLLYNLITTKYFSGNVK